MVHQVLLVKHIPTKIANNMKSSSFIYFLISLCIVLGGCGGSSDPTPLCQLTAVSISRPASGNVSGFSQNTNYTYQNDRLIKVQESSMSGSGSNQYSSNSTTNYIFNADGFVTSSTIGSTVSYNGGPPSPSSSITTYEYTGEKLTKSLETITASTIAYITKKYEYDSQGKIKKHTIQSGINSGIMVYNYTDGVLVGVQNVSIGGVVMGAYEVLNGRVSVVPPGTMGASRTEYIYDGQGRQTKRSSLYGLITMSYSKTQYANIRNPNEAVPVFRGWPTIANIYGTGEMRASIENYLLIGSDLTIVNKSDFLYQVNSQWFPTTVTENYTPLSPNNGTANAITTIYTYQNCN